MFPTKDTIEKVLDGVDLAIDFATLGEYGLIPQTPRPRPAQADERLLRAAGALPPAEVVPLRPATLAAPSPAPAISRVAPATAAGARLALAPTGEERPAAASPDFQAPEHCPGGERRRSAKPAAERAQDAGHGARRRGGSARTSASRDQLSLELIA